jgi:hypothetical protein
MGGENTTRKIAPSVPTNSVGLHICVLWRELNCANPLAFRYRRAQLRPFLNYSRHLPTIACAGAAS